MEEYVYFFIYYPRTEKENDNDIDFIISENNSEKPECIDSDEIYEDKIYYYKKVYKVKKSAGKGKKGNNYYFEFEISEDKYIISFDSKGSTFIYDITLEVGKIIIDIRRKINQDNIEYIEKIEYFEKALKKNGEENKIDYLYKDTLDVYSKKKCFYFLIFLFLRVYQKKELCTELLKKFKEMNINPKDKEKNLDRKSFLEEYKPKISEIISKSDNLIENNNYNIIDLLIII